MIHNDYKWHPVDTASIMFSSLSTKKWGRTCGFAVSLRDHEIDEKILRNAVGDLQKRYPVYFSKLKRGFFWNYLEQTECMPEIRKDDGVMRPIVLQKDARPDFRIVYAGNRMSIEGAHYITDGYGFQTFMLTLTQRYMELAGLLPAMRDPAVRYWADEPSAEEAENAFTRYAVPGGEKAVQENRDVYHFAPVYEKDYLRQLHLTMSSSAVREKANALQMTVNEYLTAVLMLAVIRSEKEPVNKPVCVDVPVNLRNFFETKTLRNFVYQVSTVLPVNGRQDWTLAEIAEKIRGQVRSQISAEKMQLVLNRLTALAANPVVRVIPNFIKTPVLRVIQKKNHQNETTIITNLGYLHLSDAFAERIEALELINGDTRGYGLPATCSVMSVNDVLTFCISSANRDNSVWSEMIRIFEQDGITLAVRENNEQPQKLQSDAQEYKTTGKVSVGRLKAFFHF